MTGAQIAALHAANAERKAQASHRRNEAKRTGTAKRPTSQPARAAAWAARLGITK